MSEYVVLISTSPEHRKLIHRHIVEADHAEDAAIEATEICSHGRNVDAMIEVFPNAGVFFSFDLRRFIPPDARQG